MNVPDSLAPRIADFPALDDQRLAGLLMKIVGGAITWVAISILFYRWHRDENQLIERDMQRLEAGIAHP